VTAPPDIYASQWNGSVWATPQRVDQAPPRVRSVSPSVAVSDAGVFVAWQDYRSGSAQIRVYSARWGGSSWVETQVAVQEGMQVRPVVFGQGGITRLVWQNMRGVNSVVYTASWGGSTWADVSAVGETATHAPYQMFPELVSTGTSAFAGLMDVSQGYRQLWLQRLGAGSNMSAWGSLVPFPSEASAGGDIALTQLGLASSGDSVFGVWSEDVYPYGQQIKFSAYANSHWSVPIRLTGSATDTAERIAPSIAARNATLAAVWSYRDASNLVNLFASFNTSAGTGAWSAPVAVLPQGLDGWILPSSIALDANNVVYVAYSVPETNGRSQVIVAHRPVTGSAWAYTQVSPSLNSDWCEQVNPQMRVGSDNKVHVVWSGCALRSPPTDWPHDSVIYYARSSDGGATFSAPVKVGLTVAQTDSLHDNDTSSRPTLAAGDNGEVMVLYPSRVNGGYSFFASLVTSGVPAQPVPVGDNATAWAGWGSTLAIGMTVTVGVQSSMTRPGRGLLPCIRIGVMAGRRGCIRPSTARSVCIGCSCH